MSAGNEDALHDRDTQAALWCLDLAEGELTVDERARFDRWHADADNADAFQRAAATWELTEAIATTPEVVRMRSDALEDYRRTNLRRWQRPRAWRGSAWGGRAWAVLASIAAAVVLMLGWWSMPDRATFRTAIGERQIAMLEDGSRLSLDADSEVDATIDRKRRSLVLRKGRAKFDVAHNPLQPFTVAVGDKLVVATGTSFSVEALAGQAHVVLYEGHVAVLEGAKTAVPIVGAAGAADARLLPGRELIVPMAGSAPASVATVPTDASLSWQQGQVGFADTPLRIAVERMNRYLAEPLAPDESASGVRVSGVFDATNAAGFLDALSLLDGVRAVRRDGKVVLTKR